MGQVNRPSNLADRIKRLELDYKKLKSALGLASAVIARGGLTLLQDAFFKMIDDLGIEIVYFGPDSEGRQIIRIKREGGSDVFWTGYTGAGNQFWRLSDRFNRELFSDDTDTGGMARPWLSVPMYPVFSMAASTVFPYRNLPVTSIATEQKLWEGRIPLVSHPFMSISGIWGQASGSNSSTYKLLVNGTEVGTWSQTALVNSAPGPFSVASMLDTTNASVQVRAVASGTGNVAAQVYGCWLRQT